MVLVQTEQTIQGFSEKTALLGVQLDYYDYVDARHSSKRSSRDVKREQEVFSEPSKNILISEIEKYAVAGTTEYQQQEAQREFDRKLKSVAMLDYPPHILQPIVASVIDYALSSQSDRTPKARLAAAQIVAAIGNNTVVDAVSVRQIMNDDKKILRTSTKDTSDIILQDRHDAAIEMLKGFGVKLYADETPPIMHTISRYINETASKAINLSKEHAKTVKAAGTIGAVAVSILTPIAAQASTPVRPVSSLSQSSGSVSGGTNASPNTSTTSETTLQVTPIPDSNSEGISFGGSASVMGDSATTPNTVTNPVVSTEHQTPVAPVQTVIETQPTFSFNAAPPTETQTPTVAVPSPVESNSPAPAPTEAIGIPAVAAPAVETVASPSSPNQTPLTSDQINAQTITSKLANDGDIEYAVSFIGSTFSADAEGSSSPEQAPMAPNATLLASLQTTESSYKDLLYANGHSDVNYIHTTQMTIAVLEAIANNPAIIQSKAVQGLVSDAIPPTDAYQLRLFNQYLATAKLPANSELIAGISDPILQNRVQEMYAYVLMADTSDATQEANIQTMKDEDAEAAKEAAAKAAAIAQAQAEAKAAADAVQQKVAVPAPVADTSATTTIENTINAELNQRSDYKGTEDEYDWGNCTAIGAAIEADLGTPIPNNWGNAIQWAGSAEKQGYTVSDSPEVGYVWQTATLTSPNNKYGHDGVVVQKNPDGSWVIAEGNHEGLNKVDYRTMPASDLSQSNFIDPVKP
jgi:surface antigen